MLLGLVLEGVRRCGGLPLLLVALVFGSYPLYADHMPAFLWGTTFSWGETIRAHVMGVESIIGIPMQVVAQLVIGFVVFGAALTVTGGGDFFMNFAISLMGKSRGGPAKVSVVSSGIMGSLSGSVISNILTTGPITIPTMKRTGYPAHYAASIEACASTGGTLMPPVMGAVAFIMASFLGVPYSDVMIAAFLPALLFYIVLIFQVDVYAARNGLKGMAPKDIPNLMATLKDGWPYLLSLFLLIYFLLVMRLEAHAPYYATLVLLATAMVKKRHHLDKARLLKLLEEVTVNVASLVAILAGSGRRDQLHPGHGHDRQRLLHLPVHLARTSPGGGRTEPLGKPSLYSVLGNALLYHPAGITCCHHGGGRGGLECLEDRPVFHASGQRTVRPAFPLCAESLAGHAGSTE